MSDPSAPLQAAILVQLETAPALPHGAIVYDDAEGADFPYVTFGECQVLPDKAECVDGVEVFLSLDAWSQKVGYAEVKDIGAAIVAKLDDQPLAVAGFRVTVFELQSAEYSRDPDGKTRRGRIAFRALIEST